MKKVLFIQSEHTLAKLSHNMGFADVLVKNGYDVAFAVSQRGKKFLTSSSNYRYRIVPQLWEQQPSSHFINTWFQNESHINRVFNSEVEVLKEEKPDLVISNASYTAKLSCQLANIPLISVIPPLMCPGKMMFRTLFNKKSLAPEVSKRIRDMMDKREANYWNTWCAPFKEMLEKCNHEPIYDVRTLLLGNFNLIHSVKEYDKVTMDRKVCEYTGPLVWQGWNNHKILDSENNKFVLCTFGTKVRQEIELIEKTLEVVEKLKEEFFLVHTANVEEMQERYHYIKNVNFIESYNVERILPKCKAVFCQGGYSLIFLCLKFGVPILAAPFHMEQMYHAKKIEQKRAGLCLTSTPDIKSLKYNIGGDVFMEQISKLNADTIYTGLEELANNNIYRQNAKRMSYHIKDKLGCESILKVLKQRFWEKVV